MRFLLAVILLIIPTPVAAQESNIIHITAVSGRYSLDVPADWVFSTEEVRGLSGTFADEIIVVADRSESMRSLQANSPTTSILGQTLIANIFPTASVTQGQSAESGEIFSMILQDELASAEFFEANGLPAVRVNDYPGPPYELATFAGLTMILDKELIYFIVYSGPDETSLEHLETIAATLTVNPIEADTLISPASLGNRAPFTVGNLTLPMISGWMVISLNPPYPTGDNLYMILAEPALSLNHAMGFGSNAILPGLFMQVHEQPYDTLYGTSDYEPTDEDRSFVLGQALANTGGQPLLGTQETIIAGIAALHLEMTQVFGGDNVGQIVLLDDGQAMYTISFIAPTDRWESDYLPLVDAIISGITFPENEMVQVNGVDIPVGTQVGQAAPDFSTTLLDGTLTTLSDFRGKIVLLNFWATWCGPCRTEMPEFQRIFAEHLAADDFVVLAVNIQEPPDLIQPYIDELGLSFPIALDLDGQINRLFKVEAYPTSYVIDRNGMIRISHAGPVIAGQVEQWIELAKVE